MAHPDWFADREPMPSCGIFEPDDVTFDNGELDEANQCLLDAFDTGEPAELGVTNRTEEGDPVTEIFRVIGDREVEVMLDAPFDRNGNLAFGHLICNAISEGSLTLAPRDCDATDERLVSSDGIWYRQ